MKYLTLLLLLLAPEAYSYGLLELQTFNMEFYELADHRDADFPYADADDTTTERWKHGYAANFNLNLIRIGDSALRFDNRVHGEATNAQVRQVGWQFEVALSLQKRVELYYGHHSQHLLDAKHPTNKYPLDNVIGARVIFYERGSP